MSAPACPKCSKPLMSRMAKLCSWCSAPIPEALRYSPEEARQIEAEEAAAKAKLEAIEQARDEKKKTAAKKAAANAAVGQIIHRMQ